MRVCDGIDGFSLVQINTVVPIKYEDMRKLLDEEALDQFRKRGMNPETPNLRGLIDGPEHYFQQVEAANSILDGVLPVVEGYLDEVHKLTGRKYGLFDYHGHPEPRHVIVACGSSVSTVEEAVNHRNAQGERVGLIKVRLWRPFSIKHLVDALPKSVEKVAVIDRVRDYLASGGPLFQEVCTSLMMGGRRDVQLVNGRYGLGSKDFTPGMALAIFDNLKQDQPLHNFVVGIKDDVTHRSLTVAEEPDTVRTMHHRTHDNHTTRTRTYGFLTLVVCSCLRAPSSPSSGASAGMALSAPTKRPSSLSSRTLTCKTLRNACSLSLN